MLLLQVAVCVSVARIATAGDFYSLSALDIHGNEVSLEQYRGKVKHYYH